MNRVIFACVLVVVVLAGCRSATSVGEVEPDLSVLKDTELILPAQLPSGYRLLYIDTGLAEGSPLPVAMATYSAPESGKAAVFVCTATEEANLALCGSIPDGWAGPIEGESGAYAKVGRAGAGQFSAEEWLSIPFVTFPHLEGQQ